jgi:hypothetical protein
VIWFHRPAGESWELGQIDLDRKPLQARVVMSAAPAFMHIVPDLRGGVWMVDHRNVRRVDASGRTLATTPISTR